MPVHLRYSSGISSVLDKSFFGTVSIILPYCSGAVPIILRYYYGTIPVRSRYFFTTFAILVGYCSGIIPVLFGYCPGSALVMCSIFPVFFVCVFLLLYLSDNFPLPVQYRSVTVLALFRYPSGTVSVLFV